MRKTLLVHCARSGLYFSEFHGNGLLCLEVSVESRSRRPGTDRVDRAPGCRDCHGGEDADVIEHVSHDGGHEPEVEHQVEEHHPNEPRVQGVDEPVCLVGISERAVRADDRCSDNPTCGVEQEFGQRTDRHPVRDRDQDELVHPLDQPEGDQVQEGENDHGDGEPQPPIDQLFEEPSVDAQPDPFPEDQPGRVRPRYFADEDPDDQGADDAPGEQEPDLADAGEDVGVVQPQVADREQHVLTPEHAQHSEECQGDQEVQDV